MMIIARVFPTTSKEELWDSLAETVPQLRIEDATPLYLAQQEERDSVSIVFDARSFDAMVPVFCDHLKECGPVSRTETAPLLRPLFFPVPEPPAKPDRFRISLKVRTKELRNVYERLVGFQYPPGIFPTYQAFSFGEDDILVSLISPTREALDELVKGKIATWKGVMSAEVTFVKKSLRIASREDWKRYRESHYPVPLRGTADEGFDWLEAAMTGAFVDEL